MTDFRPLLRWTLAAIAACIIAVVFSYYFIDRPVAYFVHRHDFARFRLLKWLTYPPPVMQTTSPLVIALLAVRRAWGRWRRWQLTLLVACVSLVVADQFRESLGELCARDWPETWHDNNPSLIGTGAYGFHPFQSASDTGSFPSGHAARIAAFLGVFWFALPRARWLYAAIALPMLIALVAMNYHFVSDVIAGTTLGTIIAAWATQLILALARGLPSTAR
jgi:membrane-associated phospholipid phosphatase